MPIITASEVNVYLGLTASTYDSIITTLIPDVQQNIAEICNNHFVTELYVAGAVTYDASALTVTMSDTTLDLEATYGFADGDDIYIDGSHRNDGYYVVASVTDNVFTLASGSTIVAELSTASPYIYVVKWPRGIKPIVATMIQYDYTGRRGLDDKQSESLGGYSYSRGNMSSLYPDAIVRTLAPWCNLRLV